MKKIRIMDSTGDTVIEFDETEAKATEEARALFERLTAKRAAVFAVGKEADKRVTDFNEPEAENIVVPRIAGG